MSVWHLRFYKRIRVLPGIWINFSKLGMSITIGVPGVHFTIGRHGATLSSGIRGTGISTRRSVKIGLMVSNNG
jgi:Protein of unknown function (DUF4236)